MSDNKSRSIFWPIILIGIGLLWLLGNFNILPDFNFGLLFSLWPLLLIVAGINLLFGRRMPLLRAVLTIAILVGALVFVYLAPSLGLVNTPEILHAEFSEPLGDATSATIRIGSSIGETHLNVLDDSSALIEAELDYVGEAVFEVTGTTEKLVELRVENEAFDSDLFDSFDQGQLRWDIGLSPEIPLVLDFSGGIGEINLNLTGLTLSQVIVNSGVGAIALTLPAVEGEYTVQLRGGVGEFLIEIAEGANIRLDINAGVGQFVIDVPDEAGVELHASTGVGSIDVPSDFLRVGVNEQTIGTSGVWVSGNHATAEDLIQIFYEGGVGGLRIR